MCFLQPESGFGYIFNQSTTLETETRKEKITSHFSLVSGSVRHTPHLISRSNPSPRCYRQTVFYKAPFKRAFRVFLETSFHFLGQVFLIKSKNKRLKEMCLCSWDLHVARSSRKKSSFESVSGD